MKNKKILSRILALCSVVVFLFALAIPCFADETPATAPVYVISSLEFVDRPSLYSWLLENYAIVTSVVADVGNGISYISTPPVYIDVDAIIFGLSNSAFVPDANTNTPEPYFASFMINEYNSVMYYIDGNVSRPIQFPLDDASWSQLGIKITVNYMTELVTDGSSTPVRSGFFGQLYYLLRDAIFGKNVVLDSSQDFTLTQISTWMTYVVILLPIILVVAIVLKAFRW